MGAREEGDGDVVVVFGRHGDRLLGVCVWIRYDMAGRLWLEKLNGQADKLRI